MPSSTRKQAARSIVLASLVILSVLAHASVASATGPPEEDVVDVPGIDGELGVWEYSALTLRADTEKADMTLDNAGWVVSRNSPETSLNRDTIGVYDEGSKVSFDFDAGDGGDADNFANEDARVIRAHVVDDGDESVPTTRAEALDLLSESTANENVEFRVVNGTNFGLDDDGEASFTDKPHDSGHYFYFLTDTGSYTIENGNFYAPSSGQSATILGMEHVVVRKGTGDVDHKKKVKPGKSITFSATPTKVSGDMVRQGVVLYEEDAYTSSMFGVDVSGELSEDFDPSEQSTLSSSIDEVNGVAKTDSDVEAFGLTMDERTVARSGGLESLLSFVSTQAGVESPTYEDRSSNHVVLNASATAVEGANDKTKITVETLDNWSSGKYRWVYVAVGENSQDMVTDTGTVQVSETDDGSSGGDTGGDTGGDSGGDTGGDGGGDSGSSGGSGGAGTGGSTGGTGAPDAGNETEKDAGTGGDGDDDDQTDEPEPASIEITDASLGASEITAGDSVDVSVTLENDGEKEGTATVRIRANDSVVATDQVTVGAGETVTETVSVTFDEPGTYEISASGTSAGTLTVTGDSSPGGAEPPEDGGGLPLMTAGIVVIISGLAGALYYFRFK